jgi:hypothetical protein
MEAASPEQKTADSSDANGAAEKPPFSLELSQDQKDIRDWVKGFAEQTVRPAAAEWDEREETPWPVIQEAAKIGLYSLEGIAQFWYDDSGIMFPIVNEELFWGDAGIGMSIMGTTLGVAAIQANGTPEQWGEWIPQCFGSESEPQVAAFCVSEPDAGSDVSSLRTRAKYDEASDEWVLNGQKAWATNGGIANVHVVVAQVDPELKARGHASFVIPPGTKGLEMGTKGSRSTACVPRTPPTSSSTTCGSPTRACWAARRSSTSAWPAPAKVSPRVARRRCAPSSSAARRSAPRRWASPAPPTSTPSSSPSSTPRSARSSGVRSSTTRPSPSPSRT